MPKTNHDQAAINLTEKFMIPARLDDKEAGNFRWTKEKGPFPEYYGRCFKCKGVTDMLIPAVFPLLQHYILQKICEGKQDRFHISSNSLQFVTSDLIQGIVQLTKDKKAIIVAVRGESYLFKWILLVLTKNMNLSLEHLF